MAIRLTTAQFIEKAKLVHNDKFNYSLVEYKNSRTKIRIVCKNGHQFDQTPNDHLKGKGCAKCAGRSKTAKEIIKEFKTVHGGRYDYSLVRYIVKNKHVDIKCKIHGVFKQTPKEHLKNSGCPRCAILRKSIIFSKTTKCFIDRAIVIHGDKYDYALVEYKNLGVKVKIKCNIHGVFKQRPRDHLNKQGCPKCGRYRSTKIAKDKPIGWNVDVWNSKAVSSKNFDSFKVYIIKCWNKDEVFYKIGRTFRKTNTRFSVGFPYNYDIIKEIIFDTAKEAFDKETELKRLNKDNKYIPSIGFGGMYECFSKEPKGD